MTTLIQFPYEQILEMANLEDEKILLSLDLPIQPNGKIQCECPIHKGDNPHGFSYCPKRKCWQCFTHKCHLKYKSNLIGLIQGIKRCNYVEAKNYIVKLLNMTDAISESELEVKKYLRKNKIVEKKEIKIYDSSIVDKQPDGSEYFITRGCDGTTVKNYKPFYCNNPNKPLYDRYCLVVKDIEGRIVGFTGRRNNSDSNIPKWIHLPRTVSTNFLFGIDVAFNKHKGTMILVEGCLGVLKLQENGILNVVATFGTRITNEQRKTLAEIGVNKLITLYDPDPAGLEGREIVNQKCQLYFNVINLEGKISKDPGHMTNEEIQRLKEIIKNA